MQTPATIKLLLLQGDPKSLRIAEIINWTGKALAAPRTEFQELLDRSELGGSGVYILTGVDADTGLPQAYIGEAEVLRERLPAHKTKDFWNQAIVFLSKDENLTKGHIKYLEGRVIDDAKKAGRFSLTNSQASGAMLPESDRHDMDFYLSKAYQLLPVLGSEIVTPVTLFQPRKQSNPRLFCRMRNVQAEGQRTENGFVVFAGSHAVLEVRPAAKLRSPYVITLRDKFLQNGTLVQETESLKFIKDAEFTSPSAAAALIQGGSANGLEFWKDEAGRALKYIESDAFSTTAI